MEIQILHKQGNKIREIARKMKISRNTVRKYLRNKKLPKYKTRPARPSKLDPFKEYIINRIKEARPHIIPASVIYKEILEMGYQGKDSIVRSFVHHLKEDMKPKQKLIRFETSPGEQMQIDWATMKGGQNSIYVFVAILGFSRKAYVEFVTDQKLPTLLRCHENAFNFFEGVPHRALYDNMKTVVVKRNLYGQGQHRLLNNFYDFAKHFGFTPKLCMPYRPQTKGKVERFISYLKYSFYYPLITKNNNLRIDELNFEVKKWLMNVAEKRFIKELRATPQYLFNQEKDYLYPLPPSYNLSLSRKSSSMSVTVQQRDLKIYEEIGGKV